MENGEIKMAIIRLKDNNQMRISLKYVSAKDAPCKKGSGNEFLYTLSSGDVMFLPAMAHQEIQSLKPMADEPFILSKVIGDGGAAVWSVERIPHRKNTESHSEAHARIYGNGTAPKPVAAARSISAGSMVAPPPSLTTRESIRIFNQLVATIQAVKAAEEFSVSIGRPVSFGPEDIRAMGISGFIEQSRTGRAA
jgi:hypothetical protein